MTYAVEGFIVFNLITGGSLNFVSDLNFNILKERKDVRRVPIQVLTFIEVKSNRLLIKVIYVRVPNVFIKKGAGIITSLDGISL